MNIYVGNLSNEATDEELRSVFESYGEVSSVIIIKDKVSSNPSGFGFVEMPDDAEANKAIEAVNMTKIRQRTVMVAETSSRVERRKNSERVVEAAEA